MLPALSVIRAAVVDLWDQLFLVVFCSVLWLLLVLLVIPGPPATVALFYVAGRVVDREDHLLEFRDYPRAVARYFWLGWRWGLANLAVLAVIFVDLRYAPELVPASLVFPVQLFFNIALAFWLVIQLYALALLFQQDELSLRLAWRNALVMLLQNPLFSLVLAAATALLWWLSLILVVVNLLAGPMFVALAGSHAVQDRLAEYRASATVSS